MIGIGEKFPAFELDGVNKDNELIIEAQWKLQDWGVIYFYPKDDTPGCTKEVCAFRDEHAQFEEADAVVLGVSCDSVAKHDKFTSKFDLPFLLLSDEDQTIVNAYGSWGPKKFMGKEYEGIERSTFLIDAKGVLRQEWRKVKVPGHVAEVLAAVRTLG